VAYALAGDIRRNLATDALGTDRDGKEVFLRELWPSSAEVNEAIRASLKVEMFTREYERIFDGDENWQRMSAPTGPIFDWDPKSTYVREPPLDRKSTRLNSSHQIISYAVFCLKKKKQ